MEKQQNSKRTTISMPQNLADRLENRKSPRQPWSGVIEELLDEVDN
jgi:metal-responsive CopG/Arc/MetJ family transcriptional regulator